MENFPVDVNPSDAPVTRNIPSGNFQTQEALLFASVLDEHRDVLLDRLRGICDPVCTAFDEHEMVFALKMADSPRVALHIRRKFNNEMSSVWHCRYIGVPVPDKVPAVCRTSIDSIVHCVDMMEFSKSMGLRMEYEYVAKGFLFTKGPIKVLVYKVYSTEKPGVYSKDLLKPQLDSHVIEAMIPVENEDTLKYSKILKDFCDQLAPLVEFKKVEYFKPKLSG